MPIESSFQLHCPVEGCDFTAHFPAGPLGDPTGAAREECLTALHLEHPNHPLKKALRDPLEANADDSVTADVKLNEGQREALRRYIAQREQQGLSGTVGLADLGEGYIKILFYDVDGNVADTQLLFSLYGDAVMPEDPTA
ncbi:MAG: hypothetical protein AB7L18_13355 [Hyphomicrobiaceae bacterium]